MDLRVAVIVVHIASAAVILGAPLGITRLIRKALELDLPALRLAADEGVRRARTTGIASMVTLWSGVGLIFLMGGFKIAPINYHIALGLMFVAVLLSALVLRPAMIAIWRTTRTDTPDRALIERSLKRMGMFQGILHLLWVCLLILMFHRIAR